MKKPVKRIIIITSSVIGLIIVSLAAFIVIMTMETKDMAPIPTGEVVPGIFAVSDSNVNLFILKSDSGYVVIDACRDANLVEKEIQSLAIDPNEVNAVLLTHSDADHAGAISLFKNADVYLSKEEEQLINGTTRRLFIFRNSLNCDYQLLLDGQEIVLDGLNVKCILTPGHTPGSMSYLVNRKWLFGGDCIRLTDGKAVLFNKALGMDQAKQRESMKKLAVLQGVEYLFTAHHGFTDQFAEAFLDIK